MALYIHVLVHVPHGISIHSQYQFIVLHVAVIIIPHAAEHVKPPMAVVPIHAKCKIGTLAHIIGGLGIKAEALALRALGLDEDDSADRGVILRPRVGYQLDALDVLAADLVQLGGVLQFAPIDVNERRALAEDLDAVLSLLHARQVLQHRLGGAHLAQQRVLDIGLEALGREFEGRTLALDDNFAQLSRFWLQRDDAQVACGGVNQSRLVTQIGNLDNRPHGIAS